MISGWYTSAARERKRPGSGPDPVYRVLQGEAGQVIRVHQAGPGVWLPGPDGSHEITVAPSPAVTAAITQSLTMAAHREVLRARAGWAVTAYRAAQREVLEENGWLEPEPGDGSLTCPGCGFTFASRASSAAVCCQYCGHEFPAMNAGTTEPAFIAGTGALTGVTGPPASAAPAGPEKRLAPDPAAPALDGAALIRSVIYGPLDLDPAELDRLAPYDQAPAGICSGCHTGAVLAGSELCWYCDLAGRLAAGARSPAERCGDVSQPAWVPGFCGCVSREAHNEARRASGHPDCDHGGLRLRFVRDGTCRRCGERSLVTAHARRNAGAALSLASTRFAIAALGLFALAFLVYAPFVLPALAAMAMAVMSRREGR